MSWLDVWMKCDDIINDIWQTLDGRQINPSTDKIFRAFELTPLNEVKVVIFGSEPSTTSNGLAFSVNSPPLSSTLVNIYKEVQSSYPEFAIPGHGDLTKWAQQGVLLLNTCLTSEANRPKAHKTVWEGVINKVLEAINQENPKCIYVMWGRDAEKLEKNLKISAIKLVASHPAVYQGFSGCKHFKLINDELIKQNKVPIDWNLS